MSDCAKDIVPDYEIEKQIENSAEWFDKNFLCPKMEIYCYNKNYCPELKRSKLE